MFYRNVANKCWCFYRYCVYIFPMSFHLFKINISLDQGIPGTCTCLLPSLPFYHSISSTPFQLPSLSPPFYHLISINNLYHPSTLLLTPFLPTLSITSFRSLPFYHPFLSPYLYHPFYHPFCITPFQSLPFYHSLYITLFVAPLPITPFLSPNFYHPSLSPNFYHSISIIPPTPPFLSHHPLSITSSLISISHLTIQ